ncbi:hypothetical protein V8G54_007392 [Vigna mungo]|uniref:Uncharacterized protein n=1 Tax=Vigna mungo TaxID=3915 RepID=A0AAQ3P1N6_VIGMU
MQLGEQPLCPILQTLQSLVCYPLGKSLLEPGSPQNENGWLLMPNDGSSLAIQSRTTSKSRDDSGMKEQREARKVCGRSKESQAPKAFQERRKLEERRNLNSISLVSKLEFYNERSPPFIDEGVTQEPQFGRLGTQGRACQVSNPSEEEDSAVLALGALGVGRWAPSDFLLCFLGFPSWQPSLVVCTWTYVELGWSSIMDVLQELLGHERLFTSVGRFSKNSWATDGQPRLLGGFPGTPGPQRVNFVYWEVLQELLGHGQPFTPNGRFTNEQRLEARSLTQPPSNS